jgi:hypothetical protein
LLLFAFFLLSKLGLRSSDGRRSLCRTYCRLRSSLGGAVSWLPWTGPGKSSDARGPRKLDNAADAPVLEEARLQLLPQAAELLEASQKLSDEERAVVGAYLETTMGVFVRYARGEGTKGP